MDDFGDKIASFFSGLFVLALFVGPFLFALLSNNADAKDTSPSTAASSVAEESYDSNVPSNPADDFTNSYDEYESDYNSDYSYEEPEEYYSDYRSNYSASSDMDCGDFDSWDDAQYYYENIADDNLDGDDDGIACESLI